MTAKRPIADMIGLARPRHWIKNIVVLMPVVSSMHINNLQAWGRAGIAVIAFCFASSFAYIINDIKDAESDRAHLLKKDRPLASGRLSVKAAIAEAVVFFLASVAIAGSVSRILMIMIGAYVALQIFYSFFLKQKALVDVICIALGFVLRAASGAVAIRVEISPWLFICMFTICLFMGFCKRCNEIVTIGDRIQASTHRRTLIAYTPELLTHLITLSAAIAVISFLFYGLNESTVERFGSIYFVYTLPIVIYAVFRFAMLSMKGCYADPTDLILRDRPFQITTAIWVMAAVVIISWGRDLDSWIKSLY